MSTIKAYLSLSYISKDMIIEGQCRLGHIFTFIILKQHFFLIIHMLGILRKIRLKSCSAPIQSKTHCIWAICNISNSYIQIRLLTGWIYLNISMKKCLEFQRSLRWFAYSKETWHHPCNYRKKKKRLRTYWSCSPKRSHCYCKNSETTDTW